MICMRHNTKATRPHESWSMPRTEQNHPCHLPVAAVPPSCTTTLCLPCPVCTWILLRVLLLLLADATPSPSPSTATATKLSPVILARYLLLSHLRLALCTASPSSHPGQLSQSPYAVRRRSVAVAVTIQVAVPTKSVPEPEPEPVQAQTRAQARFAVGPIINPDSPCTYVYSEPCIHSAHNS
ncbi:hypothetical protein BU24DRAFT_221079 [Aaosphaeria arxii CBS 175.79]|uniref:Uncharacterized protein n=1 Tax=Aaosphaeria arxii CBS 175.79 TaxID=1450172 RepID=A0A6A5XR36_9PLEO|nr:uncharacterized protein BU24DRAFT_221079 [Aaosphaeria arxii CBS 175.79]KAF2014764.1 hypothetical protein BU24DRAFT_221079 [Aaosphaeria arxii CBS 175.79]